MTSDWNIDKGVTVVGLAMLAFGVLSILFTMSFVNRSAMTEGTVVGVRIHTIEDSVLHLPTVTLVTEGGRSIEFTSNTNFGTGGWQDRIGESVTVRYDSADPTNAKIDSFGQLWGLSVSMIVMGGVFIFIGIRDGEDGESLLRRLRRQTVFRNRVEHPGG